MDRLRHLGVARMGDDQQDEKDVARRIRARGLAAGAPPREIARSIHAQSSSPQHTSLLKAHRLAHGIALDDVVEQVRALFESDGREPRGMTTSLLSCYESGRKTPGPEYIHYLCQVYRGEPAELGYERTCVCGSSHRGSGGAGMPSSEAGSRRTRQAEDDPPGEVLTIEGAASGRGEEEDDDMLRRTMLRLLGGSGVAAGAAVEASVLGAVDRSRRRMDDTLVSGTLSATMVDEWEETVAGYGRQYMTVPPLWLLLESVLDYNEVRRHVGRHQPLELQERLHRLAAELGGLAGIIMIDLGDRRMAQSFFRGSRVAADETGDRALRAWVVAREAIVPLYYGDPVKAAELARQSQDLAGSTPCAAAAMAPALEARAYARLARLGRDVSAREAEDAMNRAESTLSKLPPGHQADTAFGYTERQLRFHQGNVLTSLARSGRAADAQRSALEMYPESVALDRTLIGLDRATCRLHEGEVEEAMRVGAQVLLDTPAGHRTDIVASRARELDAAVPASCADLPATREFQEVLAGSV